ncbi:glycoside hydrolase family 27 protein [Periconia macrospinosa]|uniref:Alpha-galactosidase n=1 Tax=Periconia macrospinosa TaxID=97972 RepID=A0A2V1DQ98_9PLEO|nr:glycoside hydrolase family 27 protein [Periconia macrospinosa]
MLAFSGARSRAGSFLFWGHLISSASALVLDNGVGRLPALGWNSWNRFGCDITESQFIVAAEKFVELGLKDAGYQYVNIDDCWQVKDHRDSATGRLIPDPERFPDGIVGTANKIHDMGLKIGIYSSAGDLTCQGYQASIRHEETDAATWAEWGIDYLKYDNCYIPGEMLDECHYCVPEWTELVNGTCVNKDGLCPTDYNYEQSNTAKRFRTMRDALAKQNRTILYSLCQWGTANVQAWGNQTGSSWRMSNDINPSWERILDIWNQNSFQLNYVDFWGHPDADMLEVGNGITLPQSRSHFAAWAAMKSPLLIGCDLNKATPEEVEVMKNKYLLAFNQDPVVGGPATPYKWGTNPDWSFNASFPAEYWSGASSNGTLVLIFNPFNDTRTKSTSFSEIPELGGGAFEVTEVWSGKSLGCVQEKLEADIVGYDTAAWMVGNRCTYDGRDAAAQKPAMLQGRAWTA